MGSKPLTLAKKVAWAFVLFLFGWVLRSNAKTPENLNYFDRFVLNITTPVQGFFSAVSQRVSQQFKTYIYLVGVQKENLNLHLKNDELTKQIQILTGELNNLQLIKEFKNLKSQYSFPNITHINAVVISTKVSPFFRTITIMIEFPKNIQADSIMPGMAVISREGLVGKIERIEGHYAFVRLLTDPSFSTEVMIQRTKLRGAIRGQSSETQEKLFLENLTPGEGPKKLQVNDLVVTSGVGKFIPAGIPIGHVISMQPSMPPLPQQADIKPCVNPGKLDAVVILATPPILPAFEKPLENKKGNKQRPN